jgi:Sulfotransferase family
VPQRVLVGVLSEGPLFILAPPRSFTSVICGMIGQHPEMYGLPEVNLFAGDSYADLTERVYSTRPGFRHGLLRAVAQLGLGEQSVQTVQQARQWLEEQPALSTADLFGDLATWAAPRRLVDKSPIYGYQAESLARIADACPDASYLHLTRHPRGTCESVYRMRADLRQRQAQGRMARRTQALTSEQRIADLEDPASLWLKPQQHILAFLEGIPTERQRRVRGEDLMADPDRHLPILCEWLGISSAPEALAAMKHPEDSPYAALGPHNALFGNDPSFLRSPELRSYTPKPLSLDGPLEGGDGACLGEDVAQCARRLGYR